MDFGHLHSEDFVPDRVESLLDGLGLPLVGVPIVRGHLQLHVRVTEVKEIELYSYNLFLLPQESQILYHHICIILGLY